MEIITKKWEINLNKWMEKTKDTHGVTHPHTPWKTQMWIQKWKQWKELESPEILENGTPTTSEGHNVLWKPSIKMSYEAKL